MEYSLARLIARSLHMDMEWIATPYIPGKWLFLIQKYLFICFPYLYKDAKTELFKIRLLGQYVYMAAPHYISIAGFQGIIIDCAFLKAYIQPGAIVVDIGAHAGEFSFFTAHYLKASQIFSFEPIAESYTCLMHNATKNTYHAAICDGATRTMYVPPLTVMSSLLQSSPTDRKETVSCMQLDTVSDIAALTYIDRLKIDVEGAEWDVLQVSKETIRKSRYILIELSLDREATKPVLDITQELQNISPGIQLQHIGRIYQDTKHIRQTAVDMLFKNASTT